MIYIDRIESMIVESRSLGTTRLYFSENLRLRNEKITCLWMIENDVVDNATDTSKRYCARNDQNAYYLMRNNQILSDYLVLVNGDNEIVSKMPILEVIDKSKHGCPLMINDRVDFSKCYVERNGSKPDGDFCFVFGIQKKERSKSKSLNRFENTEIIFDGCAQGVSAILTTSGNVGLRKNYFEDSEKFRGRLLRELTIYSNPDYVSFFTRDTPLYTPTMREVLIREIMEKTLVSLVDINGDEVVYRVPLEMFSPKYQPNGVAFKFNDLRIDWKRSYVEDFSITYMGCTFNPIKMSFYFGVTLSDSVVK